MRLVIVPVVLMSVTLPGVAQEAKDAEKLFRGFEKKLAAAKAIRISLEGTATGIEDVPGVIKYKGTMVIADGNKARFEMEVEMGGKKQKSTVVSDGPKMVGDLFEGKGPSRNTPKKFFEETIAFFKHGGPVAGHVFSAEAEGVRSVATFKASAFQLGTKETIGKREVQVIEYKLTLENAPKEEAKLSLSEKLWLDVEIGLPLKRVFTGKLKKEFTYTENYSEFTLDPKLDAKLFELPKPPADDAVKRDLQAAQGTWKLVRYERQGKVWGRKRIARDFKSGGRELQLRIKGDKLFVGEGEDQMSCRLRRGARPQDHTFWLDPTTTPKRCDISIGSDWGFLSRGTAYYEGIYRFQGDRLEICLAHHPEARPTRFSTDKDHEWRWLLVYQRVPPPAK
jgi:uncharacterized protein (TIGR03067 family)